jgi:serine/threonine protein kinase
VSEQKPSIEERRTVTENLFEASLAEFAKTRGSVGSVENWPSIARLGRGAVGTVELARDPEGQAKRAVKTLALVGNLRYFEREKAILGRLNHPLIVGFKKYTPPTEKRRASIVTEFVPNGSLADHLPSAGGAEMNRLSGGTRVAIVVTGVVLAMRYLHSRRIIHRDLKPANVLLDWAWTVRIADFSHSLSADASGAASPDQAAFLSANLSIDPRYTAPESLKNRPTLKSDVFSFGSILYELLTGKAAFSCTESPASVIRQIIQEKVRPEIPEFLAPGVRDMIRDCCEQKPRDRPSFSDIQTQLAKMEFRIAPGICPDKVRKFVSAVEQREKEIGIGKGAGMKTPQ